MHEHDRLAHVEHRRVYPRIRFSFHQVLAVSNFVETQKECFMVAEAVTTAAMVVSLRRKGLAALAANAEVLQP